MMRFELRGDDKIDLADELQDEVAKEVRPVLNEARQILLDAAHRNIERYGRDAPAPPGETPATVTGNLKKLTRKLSTRVRSRGRYASTGIIFAPHTHLLEYGYTKPDGTRVLPRPFVGRTMEEVDPKVEALLQEKLL